MIDLVIHTIDGRRNIWHDVDGAWLRRLNNKQPNELVRHSETDPVICVGAIASIDVIKTEDGAK